MSNPAALPPAPGGPQFGDPPPPGADAAATAAPETSGNVFVPQVTPSGQPNAAPPLAAQLASAALAVVAAAMVFVA